MRLEITKEPSSQLSWNILDSEGRLSHVSFHVKGEQRSIGQGRPAILFQAKRETFACNKLPNDRMMLFIKTYQTLASQFNLYHFNIRTANLSQETFFEYRYLSSLQVHCRYLYYVLPIFCHHQIFFFLFLTFFCRIWSSSSSSDMSIISYHLDFPSYTHTRVKGHHE